MFEGNRDIESDRLEVWRFDHIPGRKHQSAPWCLAVVQKSEPLIIIISIRWRAHLPLRCDCRDVEGPLRCQALAIYMKSISYLKARGNRLRARSESVIPNTESINTVHILCGFLPAPIIVINDASALGRHLPIFSRGCGASKLCVVKTFEAYNRVR